MKDFINKIICGDSLQVLKEMPDNFVDMVLTDPPYNISQRKQIDRTRIDNRSLKRTGKKKMLDFNYGEWDFFKNKTEYFNFINEIGIELYRIAKDSCSIYMWGPKSEISFIEYILGNIGWHIRSTLVWCKTNPTPQIFKVGYMSSTEFCIFGSKHKGAKHYWNTEKGQVHSYWVKPICMGLKRLEHPTQKRLDITAEMILQSSQQNDIILDPFVGSGTTALACKINNRNYIGIEINPEYVKMSERRIHNEAGLL